MVRQLTKKRKDGQPYVRPAEIESALKVALGEDLPTLLKRSAIRESKQEGYLPSEVLVHVIRNSMRSGDDRARDALVAALFERCMAILCATIRTSRRFDAQQLRNEVLGQFGERLAADQRPGGNERLDFYEVRFNRAFKALRVNALTAEGVYADRFEPLPSSCDEEPEAHSPEIDSELEPPSDPFAHAEIAEHLDLIDALPPDEREAFALRYVYGYEIESVNPEE